MKTYTYEELERVLASHGVRKCAECGEYEKPVRGFDGMGGIQADDLGRDGKGRLVHAKCAMLMKR